MNNPNLAAGAPRAPNPTVQAETDPPVVRDVPPGRLTAILALLGATVLYGVLESWLWPRTLWGAHFLAYLPWATWLAAPVALTVIVLAGFWNPSALGPTRAGFSTRTAILAACLAGAWFWLLRVRHIFWGDGLPLSINIPQGQAFHPDEPLSIYIHQLLYKLGGGKWSGVTAVAIGSTLSGALFVGRTLQWFSHRMSDRGVAILAAVCLLAQGFTQIFYGYVENYAYLAVALLYFLTWGVDFLEGRIGAIRPLVASLLATALHILGGLTIVPALILVGFGLATPGRRRNTALATTAVVIFGLVAYALAAGLYGETSPFARFVVGVQRSLSSVMAGSSFVGWSWRTIGDIWSQFVIVGPLSLPLLIALIAVVLGKGFGRRPSHIFLGIATLVFSMPVLLVGRWGIGPARDWDIFAAPAITAALFGIVLFADRIPLTQARRVLLALAVASLFHTIPWIALNTSHERTMERVAHLPLGKGRGSMMLGTHFLNAGDLEQAEHWFEKSLVEDAGNINSQSGLGLALARQGRYEEALGPMTAAMELNPGRADLHRDLAALLFMLDRWQDAADEMQSLLLLDATDHAAWLGLSDCYARMGRTKEAATVLENAAAELPEHPQIREGLADAYELWVVDCARAGDWNGAYEGLLRLRQRYPNDPRTLRLSSVLTPP